MQSIDEKTIILIGQDGIGKRTFVNTLELLELTTFGTTLKNPRRKPYLNLKGEISDQEFEVLIPSYSKSYDAIKLKVIICRSIKFDNMRENLESIQCLKDYKYEFNSMFYFTDGRDNRLKDDSKMFLTNLLSVYGESFVEFITIIQSRSNEIKDTLYEYEGYNNLVDLKNAKKEIDQFYNKRTETRRCMFYELLKLITGKINERFPCENFLRYQEIALSKVAYIEFGEVKLVKKKEDDSYDVIKSSAPIYPKKFLEDYKSNYPNDDLENYDWVDIFKERINSLNTTFSFQEIDDQLIKIKKMSDERKDELRMEELAFEKAISILEESDKTNWLRSTFRNLSLGLQIGVKHFNPLNNISLMSSFAEGNGLELIESLKMLNECQYPLDNETQRFEELFIVMERTKQMLKIKKRYGMK